MEGHTLAEQMAEPLGAAVRGGDEAARSQRRTQGPPGPQAPPDRRPRRQRAQRPTHPVVRRTPLRHRKTRCLPPESELQIAGRTIQAGSEHWAPGDVPHKIPRARKDVEEKLESILKRVRKSTNTKISGMQPKPHVERNFPEQDTHIRQEVD